jgi:hypothetical protein
MYIVFICINIERNKKRELIRMNYWGTPEALLPITHEIEYGGSLISFYWRWNIGELLEMFLITCFCTSLIYSHCYAFFPRP